MSPPEATLHALADHAGAAPVALAAVAAAGLARLLPPAQADLPALAWLARSAAPGHPRDALRRAAARPAAADAPLLALARRMGLDEADLLTVALLRDVELDALWPHTLALLQAGAGSAAGTPRPTLGLLARWLVALDLAADAAGGAARLLRSPALASGLFLPSGEEHLPWSARSLSLHPQLLAALAPPAEHAPAAASARFGSHASATLAAAPDWPLPDSWQDQARHYAQRLRPGAEAATPSAPLAQLVIRAGLASEAAAVAAHLGRLLGRPVAQVEGIAAAHGEAAALPPGLEPWLMAHDALPLFVADAAPGDQLRLPAWQLYRGPALVALGPDGDVEPAPHGATRQWRLALPPVHERAAVWREALGAGGAALDATALAQRHPCGVSTVHAAAAAARHRAGDAPVSEAHVAAAACEDLVASSHGLGALAQWLPHRGAGQSFVAEGALQRELQLALAHCRWREPGGQALGPAVRARWAGGVKLLLIGPSGTGKTLAARWLAESLGKPLYRVDLAAVTSKYIGESEKNLSQLLSRAEQLDCVLLFDEADALFGARTEVKQANDRFANTQTNYLLQRIEEFSGIAVLTSNSKARFDDAFMRRLDHVLEFPLPRGAARAALWRAHLGDGHALSEAQIGRLAAEVDLAGGHIRNIAVAALMGAALELGRIDGVVLEFRHVARAAVQEFAKLGRRAPEGLAAAAA